MSKLSWCAVGFETYFWIRETNYIVRKWFTGNVLIIILTVSHKIQSLVKYSSDVDVTYIIYDDVDIISQG